MMKRIRKIPKGLAFRLLRMGRMVIEAIRKLLAILDSLNLAERFDRLEREVNRMSEDHGRMEDRIVSRIESRIARSGEELERRILAALEGCDGRESPRAPPAG